MGPGHMWLRFTEFMLLRLDCGKWLASEMAGNGWATKLAWGLGCMWRPGECDDPWCDLSWPQPRLTRPWPALPGGPDKTAAGAAGRAPKDAEDLSDSFDKDFVLIDLPVLGPSGSQLSHTGSSTLDASRHASQASSMAHVEPPTNHLAHLVDVASLVHQLALAKRDGGFPGDAFAAAMLALQVLDRAGQLELRGPHQGGHVAALGMRMAELLQLSEGLSRRLGASAQQALPNVYEMVFQHALSFSRGAAADELMGNYARSSQLYAKAQGLLWFLSQEAPQMGLQPQIVLSPQEAARLQQYMATVSARRSACSSMPNL